MYCLYCRMHGGKLGWLVLSRILGGVGTQFYYRKVAGAIPLHLVLGVRHSVHSSCFALS